MVAARAAPVYQMQQLYRYGQVDDCTGRWRDFYDCLKKRTKFAEQVGHLDVQASGSVASCTADAFGIQDAAAAGLMHTAHPAQLITLIMTMNHDTVRRRCWRSPELSRYGRYAHQRRRAHFGRCELLLLWALFLAPNQGRTTPATGFYH